MATLMVAPFAPSDGSGSGLRTVGIARALARLDDLEVAYVEFGDTRVAPALEADPRIRLQALRASRGAGRVLAYARARLAGTPRAFARGVSPELLFRSDELARFERVIAVEPTVAAALVLVSRNPGVVYNASNLEHRFRPRFSHAKREYGSPAKLLEFERRILARSLETWLPTRAEVRQALDLVPDANVRYVPNVVDVRAITTVAPSIEASRILFVADFSYEPNQHAASLLVEDVMPRLWRRVPGARLTLVGRSLQLPVQDARVEALGFVDKLADAYSSATCVVVPLLEGGGSPLKLVEAFAYGMPVVATGRAAASLDGAVNGTHYLEANDADALAEALAEVLTGAYGELGRNGRRLVESGYSIEALVEHLR